MKKKQINIGLIGAGFMGRCHANAFRLVGGLFELAVEPVPWMLADVDQQQAQRNAELLGYRNATDDWRKLCAHPEIDLVAVTAPNALHEPIALAALEAGKTVYCEKPLSTNAASALRMVEAAEAAGALTMVGFNFLRNPVVKLACEIIQSGEIGEIIGFRGRHAENYMVDPQAPHSFRTDAKGGGALADIGSHIICMARYLLGPINEVSARCHTQFPMRPVAAGSKQTAPVLVDDMTHALVVFANGATGSIEANWAAYGRNIDLSWEVSGVKGSLYFSQERMNELHYYKSTDGKNKSGFTKIEAGPAHAPYASFCPAPGHQLGFNDLKVIEVAELLQAVAGQGACGPDFREAYGVQRTVDAILASHKAKSWMAV